MIGIFILMIIISVFSSKEILKNDQIIFTHLDMNKKTSNLLFPNSFLAYVDISPQNNNNSIHSVSKFSFLKEKINEIAVSIRSSFIFLEDELVRRCFFVIFLAVITIVLCCLGLQVMIALTKNCKLALNEIAVRERKSAFNNF